jgi:nucleotidyltransferase AbiEii toxin of type IV toxin-antitoxin system
VSGAERFLARVVGALNSAGVPYMLAGSFASSLHGAPRATQDIDLVADPTFDSLDRFLGALSGDDVYFDADVARDELKRRGQFKVIDGSTAWKVDIIFRKGRPFSREEMSRRVAATVLGVDVFVATAEDTVLAKLEWAKLGESERQLRDVRAMLETKGASLDVAYVERWLDELGIRELWERVQGQ